MASTVTTNAVAGAIMNPAEASGNPVESKCFIKERFLFEWNQIHNFFFSFLGRDSEKTASAESSIPLTPSTSETGLTTTDLKTEMDPSGLQPITLPVMNSLVSTNKVVVDASIDAEMVPEFPSDAAQNPLDYIHKG